MNKLGIIDAVHEKIGGTKVQAEQAVETVIETIVSTLKRGGEVSLAGLGIFSTKNRAARQARNPRTGAEAFVPAKNVVVFKVGKLMRERVSGTPQTAG